MNKRPCKQCGEYTREGIKINTGYFCNYDHAIKFANAKVIANKAKTKKADLKQRKDKLKTRAEWLKEAQTVFNKYIRLRDNNQPCISCQRHHEGQYHAGHYKSVGSSPSLRFNEDNCHKQCAPCNNHLSGNISNYRPNLITKIGIGKVEEIEKDHKAKKYTIEEIKELIKVYKQKVKNLL